MLYTIIILILLPFFSYAQVKPTIIESKIFNFYNEIELEDKSEFEALSLPNQKMYFVPDSTRFKKLKFYKNEANYYRLGRNILYLSPGDSLVAEINYNDPMQAKFSGSHSVENDYLKNTPFPKAGSFLDAGDALQSTIKSTIQIILKKADNRNRQLDSIQNLVSSIFYSLEKARIKADIINSLQSISTYYFAYNKTSEDSINLMKTIISNEIEPFLKRYTTDFVNPTYLKISVYRDVLGTILKYQSEKFAIPNKITDWMAASELKRKAQKTSDQLTFISLKNSILSIRNNEYKRALYQTFSILSNTIFADSATDFPMKNIAGNRTKLLSFKGKMIYLNLWATWCGPCIEKMPFVERLQEKYKDSKDVIVLSVSIDDDELAWKKWVQDKQLYQHQYIAKRPSLFKYNITSVPRSILIDKSFKIIKLYADDPNSSKLDSLLNSFK